MRVLFLALLVCVGADYTKTMCKLEKYREYPMDKVREVCLPTDALPYCYYEYFTVTYSEQIWSFSFNNDKITYHYTDIDPNSHIRQGESYDCYFDENDPKTSLRFDDGSPNWGMIFGIVFGVIFYMWIAFMACKKCFGSPQPVPQTNHLVQIEIEQKEQKTINDEIKEKVQISSNSNV